MNKREIAEDGEIESHGLSIRHPVSSRGQPPGWFILHERKAEHSKLTVLPAHRLAGEPGAPIRFTFHEYRPGDSNPDHPRLERGVSTVGLGRHGAAGRP